MARYKLKCLHPDCGRVYDTDDDFRLKCDGEINGEHGPAFLRCTYEKTQIDVRSELPGIFKFFDWLPTGTYYLDSNKHMHGRPYCYKSSGLGKRLGLENLYIAFSGYWPEKGPDLLTRSFKEFEAQATVARWMAIYKDSKPLPLIISSAGNTANGFNLICHLTNIPLYIIVPEIGLDKLMLPFRSRPFVIVSKGDYSDAISLADRISERTGLMSEGGSRNVARRAGMAAVMLNAVAHPEQGAGSLFDHYFQAIGSGTGAIAAWEAIELLRKDGRFGSTVTEIHMAQNMPFTPIVDSWHQGQRELVMLDERTAKEQISSVTADVLTNRYPPYSIAGGLYDVLKASNGCAWRVDNYHLFHAARMFREVEGVDIGPAAAVAVDALRQAAKCGRVQRANKILLHITGGGKEIQYTEGEIYGVKPRIVVEPKELEKALTAIGTPNHITDSFKYLKRYE